MRKAAVTLIYALLIGAALLALANYFDLPMVREAGGAVYVVAGSLTAVFCREGGYPVLEVQ